MSTATNRTNEIAQGEFVRAGEFATRNVAGQTVVVPVRGLVGDLNSIFMLNETGSLMWSMLESPQRETELVAAVVDSFEVSPEDAETDVRDYLNRLLAEGMIQPSGGR